MKFIASSDFIFKLHKSRKILLTQLKKRGYNIDDYQNYSVNEINLQYQKNQLDMLLENDETKKKVYIKYHLPTKLAPKHIYEYIDDLYNLEEILSKADDLIILIKNKPNDTLMNCMNNIYNTEGIYFAVFDIHRLQFDILEHTLVPPHRVLENAEIDGLKDKYNITNIKQLPGISRFDPVAQIIGLRPNQICEIERPSKTAIVVKYYRLCY